MHLGRLRCNRGRLLPCGNGRHVRNAMSVNRTVINLVQRPCGRCPVSMDCNFRAICAQVLGLDTRYWQCSHCPTGMLTQV
jgi:hypothetical protein